MPYISMGTLVRQELNPASQLYRKVGRIRAPSPPFPLSKITRPAASLRSNSGRNRAALHRILGDFAISGSCSRHQPGSRGLIDSCDPGRAFLQHTWRIILFLPGILGFPSLGDFWCLWKAVSHIIFLMIDQTWLDLSLPNAFWYFWKFSRDIPVDSCDLHGSSLRLCRATIFLRISQFTELFLTPTSILQTKHYDSPVFV